MDIQFGTYMKNARVKAGLTQQKLADMARINVSSISLAERSLTSPTLYTLAACADVLGISLDEYIGREAPERDGK